MDAKCSCQNCAGHIAFEPQDAGKKVVCPHCGWDTILSVPPESKPAADHTPATSPLIPLIVIAATIVIGTLVYASKNCLYPKPAAGIETTNNSSATAQSDTNSNVTTLNDTNPSPSVYNSSSYTPSPEKKAKHKKKKQK